MVQAGTAGASALCDVGYLQFFFTAVHRKNKPSLSDAPDSPTSEELEIRCLQLQTQVWEMEVRHLLHLP